ncbi:fructose bisphosphate aldolase [Sphingorhabdus sp. 109]|jgi:fructose-bisphosphate aldolase class I|uniref:fructose bisphosphate aldolase n=1 Tax=Sphingorhabdus sp. 109 TaxID=2653173 RepID=UPI0012F3C067|nr:fructose bisphosphate aldolase [Sphingorhabdus sp. 109]VWX56749.1 Fructose-bisphosphate aldolase class 1 [Sphingorhabdus sp. 109]
MANSEMMSKIENGQGFIAALDQSGGSTPKALAGYGIGADSFSNDDEMFGLIHKMRSRIITSPSFGNGKVIGAILFEKTMNGDAGGKPVPEALWDRGVVPFLKVDKGLQDEADGVQLMKPIPDLDEQCKLALSKGVFGTKMRSVINKANAKGIAAIVAQQFDFGKQILANGLVPIIEPEVNIKSDERAECDQILLGELTKHLDALADDQRVMLKLSIPVEANLYKSLVDHPKVVRLVALSGGYSTEEACAELAKNEGMIASFSRGLLQDLRVSQSDEEFDAVLGGAIDQIYRASIA